MNYFRNILVGIDLGTSGDSLSGNLSPANLEAVERALEVAERTKAAIAFVAVLDAGDTTRRLIHDAKANASNVFDEAHALLSLLVQRAAQRGISAEARVLMGKSWLKLIQEVLKHHHDLVVIGTRHEGVVDRVLYGSTAMKLLRKCPCQVWVTELQRTAIAEWNAEMGEREQSGRCQSCGQERRSGHERLRSC